MRSEFWGKGQARIELLSCTIQELEATEPEHRIPVHTHDHGHFVFVQDGGYISSATDAPDLSRLPLLVFNPPGTTHRDRFLHGRGEFLTVTVYGDLQPTGNAPVAIRSLQALHAAWLLKTKCRAGHGSRVSAEGALLALMAALRTNTTRKGSPPAWLKRAHEMIWRSNDSSLSVLSVAKDAGVHPVHLARVFSDYLGCSPGEALRGRRLERVAAILGRSNAGLADAALACGFADQSHMTRTFARAFSMTPAAYRRSRNVSNVQDGLSRAN